MTQEIRHYINRERVSGDAYEIARDGGFKSPRYDAEAVNDAIAASNRAGRRISGHEAKLIHALLQGRQSTKTEGQP